MKHEKQLFANLTTEQTFLEWGRIFFSVINTFKESGYKISILNNAALYKLGIYGQPVFELQNVKLVDKKPPDTENYFYLFDQKDNQLNQCVWQKQVFLKYDLYSSYYLQQPMIMPFPVHPLQEIYGYIPRLPSLRSTKRNISILFAGDIDKYKRVWVKYPKEKLPRQIIIEAIKDQLNTDKLQIVADETALHSVMSGEFINKFVIIDNEAQRIDSKLWLDTLAKAQFFFSPPGIVMPMCHNITEAMAIGCIPITNYPEWMQPNLQHGVNCIVFDTHQDLMQQIENVLNMDASSIQIMKDNVIEYYEKYLKKSAFIERLEAYPLKQLTILYYTEGNVAKNKEKLNKYSVLMRDTTAPLDTSTFRYKIMRLLGRA